MPDWNDFRKNFPVTESSAYLNSAGFSVTNVAAVKAVKDFAEKMLSVQEHSWADEKRNEARDELAKLIHASKSEVGLGEGATYALTAFARGIANELESGDNIVTSDMEFLQSTLPWATIARRKHIEIRAAKNTDGKYDTWDFQRLIDGKTRVIAISSIQWNNGFKMDIEALGEMAESKDIYFVVDAAQHLGASDFDTRKVKADFLAASGHKWLVSPFGTGVFYVSSRVLDSIDPDFVGYINSRPPRNFTRMIQFFENPDSSPLERFEPIRDEARKFEVGGTSNYPGAVAIRASLKLLNEAGITNVTERVLDLGDYLIRGLQKEHVRIVSPIEREKRGGITTFHLGKTPQEEKDFIVWLKERRIYVSLRYASNVGGIRVSTHAYNNEADVDRLLDAVREYSKLHS